MADPDANDTAISQLFRDHNHLLVAYLTLRLGSRQEAKEVAQEAYARLLQLRETRSPILSRAYLFKTATNVAIDRHRRRTVEQRAQEQQKLFTDLNRESDDPASQLQLREQAHQLLGYLQELPMKCQKVLQLHRIDGMSQHEVAARLGLSDRMVRRYITYAMVYCALRTEGMMPEHVRQRVTL